MAFLKKRWKQTLSEADRVWLSECLNLFENRKQLNPWVLKSRLGSKIPDEYDFESLSNRNLCEGTDITLLGVLHVDEHSEYYLTTEKTILAAKQLVLKEETPHEIESQSLEEITGFPIKQIRQAFKLFRMLGEFSSGWSGTTNAEFRTYLGQNNIIKEYSQFTNLEKLIDNWLERKNKGELGWLENDQLMSAESETIIDLVRIFEKPDEALLWRDIEKVHGMTKRKFGNQTNFIKERFQKNIIFRDIAQAHFLVLNGFPKPAVILCGSVLEELLRLYLEEKGIKPKPDTFNGYVKACVDNDLLSKSINGLSDAVRVFRNVAHIKLEKTKKETISKSTAGATLGLVFTIAERFD